MQLKNFVVKKNYQIYLEAQVQDRSEAVYLMNKILGIDTVYLMNKILGICQLFDTVSWCLFYTC